MCLNPQPSLFLVIHTLPSIWPLGISSCGFWVHFFTTPTDFDSFLDVWSDKMLHFHLAHLMEADISPKSPGSWEMVFKNLSLVLVVLIASELVIVQVFVSGQS